MSQDSLNREDINKLATEYGYNKFMIHELMVNYPNDYMGVINAFEKPPREVIRVNTLKTTPKSLEKRLSEKGFSLRETKWIDYGFQVDSQGSEFSLGATHEYLLGHYYIQSLGSMIPVHILSPQPNDNIIDLCAAPGSKFTQMGQLMKNKGNLIGIDLKPSRINAIISNTNRCGIENAICFNYDAKDIEQIPKLNNWANKILLDAPCTGSGIIRKDRSRKSSRTKEDINTLAEIQKSLLSTALKILKPEGFLVYSTCSFHYQENEQVIAEVTSTMDNIEIVEPFITDIGLPGLIEAEGKEFGYKMLNTRRLYPNLHDTDAFFYCLLKKH